MSQQIYFTSDQHFGHENVLRFCNRPFSSTDEMNEELIKRHNEVVKTGDLVYLLGDLFWRSLGIDKALEIASRLNGQKYYIWGNHEELMQKSAVLRGNFIWCKDIAKIRPNGHPHIVMLHYCMKVWEGSHRGAWHLFGHSHNALSKSVTVATKDESALSMDVGVDTHNYYPWSLEEIAQEMNTKRAAAASEEKELQ